MKNIPNTSYISPEAIIISLVESTPILGISSGIEDWTNDDNTLDF